jgi:hypothetical protein
MSVQSFTARKTSRKETGIRIVILLLSSIFTSRLTISNSQELQKASGGAWGGVNVDSAFVIFLEKLFGSETIRTFRETHLYDYLELEREFEMVKREVKIDDNSCIIPASIFSLSRKTLTCRRYVVESIYSVMSVQSFTARKTSRKETGIHQKHNHGRWPFRIRIRAKEHTNSISGYKCDDSGRPRVGCYERSCPSITTFLFSGCFPFLNGIKLFVPYVSIATRAVITEGLNPKRTAPFITANSYVQKSMQTAFPDINVLIPEEPELAVMKGAVLFGFNPSVITARVAMLTYGTNSYIPFKNGIPENHF